MREGISGSAAGDPPQEHLLRDLSELLDSLAVEAAGKVCVATLVTGGVTAFDPNGGTEHFAVPDPVTTESIQAYVVLRPGVVGDAALVEAIRESVRTRLARHETPRAIEFVDALPMTATGKIMRRELRQRARRQG